MVIRERHAIRPLAWAAGWAVVAALVLGVAPATAGDGAQAAARPRAAAPTAQAPAQGKPTATPPAARKSAPARRPKARPSAPPPPAPPPVIEGPRLEWEADLDPRRSVAVPRLRWPTIEGT